MEEKETFCDMCGNLRKCYSVISLRGEHQRWVCSANCESALKRQESGEFITDELYVR